MTLWERANDGRTEADLADVLATRRSMRRLAWFLGRLLGKKIRLENKEKLRRWVDIMEREHPK